MKLELRVELDDAVQEYSFFRRRISMGQGPFNDIVIDLDSVGPVLGAFETGEDGTNSLQFVRRSSGPRTRLFRDGSCIDDVAGDEDARWDIAVGDRIVIGDGSGAEISVLSAKREESQPWSSVPLSAGDHGDSNIGHAEFLARSTRRIASVGGLEPVLEEVGLLVATRAGHTPTHLEFSVPVEVDPWRSDQFGLRGVALTDGEEWPRLEGTFYEDRRSLPPLAEHAPESLDALRGMDRAVVVRPSETRTDVFVPVPGSNGLCAVLDLSFDDALGEDAVAEIVALCELLLPQAARAVRDVRLERTRTDLAEENRYFRERQRRHYLFKDLIAESEAMREVYDQVNRLVELDEPVLILGEAGTGKSLIARALHHLGRRREGMLTSLNCGDLEGELLDVELFGCVASDLAGDVAARKGVFELASQGTVFLEEIDQLSLLLQGKLLRMLRESEVRRIGDAVARRVDTRLVASSHRDLCKLVEAGTFRRDLWMALKGQSLRVPALRERRRDILPLARTFLKQFASRYGRDCTRLSDEVEEILLDHAWPGNVRELQTVVEAATLNCGGDSRLTTDHFVL